MQQDWDETRQRAQHSAWGIGDARRKLQNSRHLPPHPPRILPIPRTRRSPPPIPPPAAFLTTASSPLAPKWTLLLVHLPPSFLSTYGLFVPHEVLYWGTYVPAVPGAAPGAVLHAVQAAALQARDAVCNQALRLMHPPQPLPTAPLNHPSLATAHLLLRLCNAPLRPPFPPDSPAPAHFLLPSRGLGLLLGPLRRALPVPVHTHFHTVHYVHATPFGVAAEYAYPFEVLFLRLIYDRPRIRNLGSSFASDALAFNARLVLDSLN